MHVDPGSWMIEGGGELFQACGQIINTISTDGYTVSHVDWI